MTKKEEAPKSKMKPIERIMEMLNNYERSGSRILFAVESGSRLWGMSSNNSDYDVRFVYADNVSQYLMIKGGPKDTVEINDEDFKIDMVGWDIKKFLTLASNSNPSALEWVNSDIIYQGFPGRYAQLLDMLNPRALFEHYCSMGMSNYRRYIKENETVKLKKYLYVMRGIINALYVKEHCTIPPPRFENAISDTNFSDRIRFLIMDLIKKKQSSGELGEGPRIPEIDEFVENMVENLEKIRSEVSTSREVDYSIINKLFQESIGYK